MLCGSWLIRFMRLASLFCWFVWLFLVGRAARGEMRRGAKPAFSAGQAWVLLLQTDGRA